MLSILIFSEWWRIGQPIHSFRPPKLASLYHFNRNINSDVSDVSCPSVNWLLVTPRHKWFRQSRTYLTTYLRLENKLKDQSIALHSPFFRKSTQWKGVYTTNDKFTLFLFIFNFRYLLSILIFSEWWRIGQPIHSFRPPKLASLYHFNRNINSDVSDVSCPSVNWLLVTPRHKWFRQSRTYLTTYLRLENKLKDQSIALHSPFFRKSTQWKGVYTTNDKFTLF